MASNLSSWSQACSSLMLTEEALRNGRAKAIAVWNACPTDSDKPFSDIPLSYGDPVMVEDAAHAFAFLDESLRIDSQKTVVKGSGVEGDPARNLSALTELALRAVADYTKWVADTKPLTEAGKLGI